MIKVAFFTENLYGGGVQKIMQTILQNFDYKNYDVTVYTNFKEDFDASFYPINLRQRTLFSTLSGSLIHDFFCKVSNKVRLWVYYHCSPSVYYNFFIREKYDVGIAFIEGYATRFLSGAPVGMKKIAWLHIELENFHWTDVAFRNRKEEKMCYGKMDKIVCVSRIVKNQAVSLFGIPTKTVLLHNPIDTKKIIRLAKEPIGEKYRRKNKSYRLVSLGSLDKRKGYDRLIRVVHKIIDEGFDAELYILGKGKEEDSLRNYIAENGLDDNIKLFGYIENPYPYVLSSDIYVCSSLAEGYNTAVTEAMILGRAVLSTEVSGTREQLGEHSQYGIIADNSIEGLYEAIKEMMKPGMIERFQKMSLLRSKEFNLEIQMNEIYNLIDQ